MSNQPPANISPATPLEDLPAFLTAEQAAAYLQLARRTVSDWCASGQLAAANIGGTGHAKHWRIPKSEIVRLLATR